MGEINLRKTDFPNLLHESLVEREFEIKHPID